MLADKEIKKNDNDGENMAGRFDGFRSYNQIASGTYPHKNIEYDRDIEGRFSTRDKIQERNQRNMEM